MSCNRNASRAVVAAVVVAGFSALAPADPPKRVPWTTSRLVGSPDPPLPYTVEKTFAKVTWKQPLYVADEPGTNRLWVVEEGARIRRIADDPAVGDSETLLEIPKRLVYSVCFHPRYAETGHVYVFSNGPREAPKRKNRIARYTVGRQPPYSIDPATEVPILEWESAGHDGGDMAFGPDGLFYISTGDGTSDSDTWNSGQTLDDLLGSVLRIDVDRRDSGKAYAVPPDNPFVATPGACPEIWAYGLRNPWRMCCDPTTGQLWVGNNGQDLWETAHLVRRGENYGWSVTEGSHPFYPARKRGPTPIVAPTIEHSHAEFRSLTGGVVYRGDVLPELRGAYVYGDYSTGRVWAMKHDGTRPLWHRELARTTLQIAAFRVSHRGELLIVDHGGGIYRLVPTPPGPAAPPFPTLLSQTGLFASTANHRVNDGLIPYTVNAPGWANGADAERFLAVPGDAKVGFDAGRGWTLPDGTALVQTLSRESMRLETRVLLRQHGEWAGYTYRWNSGQTDATLVPTAGENGEGQWRFPSRAECLTCHSRAAGFVLGVTGAQLNRDNQLSKLADLGLFAGALPKDIDRLTNPGDATQDLERRVRTYLHVNCSICHVEAGGGNAKLELGLSTPRDKMNLQSARPQHDTFGLADAMLVAPGSPERSVLLHRLRRRGRGQMPPLCTNRVDEAAVRLVRDWIASLKPERPFVQAWAMDDFASDLDGLSTGRSIEAGRKAFLDTGCGQCHRFEGDGGSVGPDLAGIGRRQKPKEVLESILLPSKVIADEYATTVIETTGGTVVIGRIEREAEGAVVLRPTSGDPVTVPKKTIVERRKSDVSNMPPGIVNVLRKDEILDLVAYLISNPKEAR